jgi:hypothetical protein
MEEGTYTVLRVVDIENGMHRVELKCGDSFETAHGVTYSKGDTLEFEKVVTDAGYEKLSETNHH